MATLTDTKSARDAYLTAKARRAAAIKSKNAQDRIFESANDAIHAAVFVVTAT